MILAIAHTLWLEPTQISAAHYGFNLYLLLSVKCEYCTRPTVYATRFRTVVIADLKSVVLEL